MPGSHDDLPDALKDTIHQLTSEVRSLAQRVEKLERSVQKPQGVQIPSVREAPARTVMESEKVSPWSVGGAAALMSRGAVISLVLLLALVLRTLTDSGTLGMKVGTTLGIGYATFLEGVGWFMYRRKSSFAPILSISGALLLAAVVLETHASFGSISTLPAYLLLAVAGGGMAVISRQFKVAIPVNAGTMAVLLAGVSMGFPDTNFPALTLFLITVNIMAFTAANLSKAGWLRIVTFFITAVVVLLWGYKLRFTLLSGTGRGIGALLGGPGWFYGVIAFYVCFYIGYPVLAIWRNVSETKKPFDHILPSLTAAWAYLASLMVVQASGANVKLLGMVGVGVATGLLGLAAIKGSRAGTQSRGTTTFAFPATLLLALSFRDVSGESVLALAILSWGALSLAWLSSRWSSAGVRVISYFLQATVLGASFLLLLVVPAGDSTLTTIISMGIISLVAFFHYKLLRKSVPPGGSAYFARFDTRDISGVVPLMVSVGAGFLLFRAVLFALLPETLGAFQAGETIIINIGALTLFLAARFTRNAEVKWIAVLVTIMGGGKVFLYDLFKVKGLPVVLSVLSFVLAAAIGSWVLGKWPRPGKNEVVD
ncbi:MAG: hypothetical protein P1S59_10675 [bacterium]|nr:hypothetical protein [bacterium]